MGLAIALQVQFLVCVLFLTAGGQNLNCKPALFERANDVDTQRSGASEVSASSFRAERPGA